MLDLLYACWEHLQRALAGICRCAKFGFGWNRFSNLDNMQVLISCHFGLKMHV